MTEAHRTSKQLVRVPDPDPIDPLNVWEHTPLDYARYGEYPRFIRPPGPRRGDCPWHWEFREAKG